MDIVIKAKHWQIFGPLILAWIAYLAFGLSNEFIGDIAYIAYVVIHVGWILILGTVLKKRAGNIITANYSLFLGTGILMIILVGAFRLMLTTRETFEIMESAVCNIGFAIYGIISIGILYSFPVKILKSMEKKEEAGMNDYFGDIFVLMFWPIGIWFIQPRLNKIENTFDSQQ